jgi:hypothetical protein
VVIVGPAGVGKTRLGEECVDRAGLACVAVRATRAAATIPLGAFGPFLPGVEASGAADHMSLRRAAESLA